MKYESNKQARKFSQSLKFGNFLTNFAAFWKYLNRKCANFDVIETIIAACEAIRALSTDAAIRRKQKWRPSVTVAIVCNFSVASP
ncbi:hypothetical protein [Rhizobium sp. RAF56]|uniref:hypothetical protein n=1 Tax=Rhizobium sp. RAF56 TaxID=3233062 RepID=UPI003F975F99